MEEENEILDLLEKGVRYGESLEAEFMEIRYDNLLSTTIQKVNMQMKEAATKQRKGIGIMAYFQGAEGSSFTPDLTLEGLKKAVKTAVEMAKSNAKKIEMKLPFSPRNPIKDRRKIQEGKHPKHVEFEEKVGYLDRINASIQEILEPKSTRLLYGEFWGDKIFLNSEGSEIIWHPLIVNIGGLCVDVNESGTQAMGIKQAVSSTGLDAFKKEKNSPERVGKIAAERCKDQLKGKSIKAGKYRALVGPELTGVLAHESFGHLSESDRIVNGMSPIADQLNQRLGTDAATIIDEGTLDYDSALQLPYDDQGTPTKKTILLEKGILKGFLHNRGTAAKLDMEPTGNSRAVNFMYPPIPRMKNTYFAPGDLSQEEALEKLGTGIYAVQSMGGQVSLDGNFLFQCSRGYYVENGEIQYPIKDVALSGNILNFLNEIESCSKQFKIRTGIFGGCGKAGQFPLYVGMGGPDLVVNEVLIGGNK